MKRGRYPLSIAQRDNRHQSSDKNGPNKNLRNPPAFLLQETLLGLSVHLGGVPNGEAEGDLVNHIGQVVDQAQRTGVDGRHEVAEEVSQGVDGPADGDDEAHGAESGGDENASLLTSDLAGLTVEDFVQNVEPSAHAEDETGKRANTESVLLTAVPEGKHGNCSEEEAPEHHSGDAGLDGGEDQVELDHLPC